MPRWIKTPAGPVKDGTKTYPVPISWRPAFTKIARAFSVGDYKLSTKIPSVAPLTASSIRQIRAYVEEYGETLIELPEDTWASSCTQWNGECWNVLVDLWTKESGRSDMVISATVFEEDGSYRIQVDSVHVP